MDKLNDQVQIARRRLNLQGFLSRLPWCAFAALLLAAVAITLRKWTFLEVDVWTWNASWLGGAAVVGILAAATWTRLGRQSDLAAAVEIDHRFGLKERVSSSLALSEHQRETEAGQALISDAASRMDRINVTDRFGVSLSRRFLLPVLPVLIALAVIFFVEETVPTVAQAQPTDQIKKQIQTAAEAARKRFQKRQKEAATKGLTKADDLFKEIEQGLRELEKKGSKNRKQALIKLNKLIDKLDARRQSLGGKDEMKKELSKLNPKKKGPADKLAKAIKNGDFNKALNQLQELKNKMAKGGLSDKDKKKLAEQLKEMGDKLKDAAKKHKEKKKQLEEERDQAKKDGDQAKADQLQDKISQMEQLMPQMDGLGQMGQKLSKAAQGDKKALDELTDKLTQMQQEMDELETLDQAMDDIQQCKNGMCKTGGYQPGAEGQKPSPGQRLGKGLGQEQGDPNKRGDGLGSGRGKGDRPLTEDEVDAYDTSDKHKIRKGPAVIVGDADGPNSKGRVRQAIKETMQSEDSGPADPLSDQRLKKSQRKHVEEYFESLR